MAYSPGAFSISVGCGVFASGGGSSGQPARALLLYKPPAAAFGGSWGGPVSFNATASSSGHGRRLLQVVVPSRQSTGAAAASRDRGVDAWGAVLLGASLAVVLLYLLLQVVRKRLNTARLSMDPKDSAAVRLAAARGDVRSLHALAGGCARFHVDAALNGFTALHAAAVEGQAAALLWLCQHGADVAAVKADGWADTALHYAAARNHSECVLVLLAHGASLDATNYAGHTAVELAARGGHRPLSAYLQRVQQGKAARPTPASLTAALHRQLKSAAAEHQAAIDAEVARVLPADAARQAAAPARAKAAAAAVRRLAAAATKRAWEGVGSQGTQLAPGTHVFRALAVLAQLSMVVYIAWRSLRTLNTGWGYFFSVPFFLCEFSGFVLSNAFIASMWNQLHRPPRYVGDMMGPELLPAVDVFIATYSEPVDVVEPTVIAALNLNYPGRKLCVHLLDDGRRPDFKAMVKRLSAQARYMGRDAQLLYLAREKAKGVPHHNKAGNINSALLKESPGAGAFVLVLDCDMVVHPDFLQATLGHFYCQMSEGRWKLKPKAAFLQTPQDFYNVDASDPLVNCARFFYGPMLQGRDGIGACPCCGTGVIFRRDILTSMGGQSTISVTEDYATAMSLLAGGFATMFLDERLVMGLAPDDLHAALTQRLRWAMGALQILATNNPLALPGLSTVQALLFFESMAHHYLALSTVALACLPIPFLFTGYSPVVAPSLWEFTLVFGTFFVLNRIMLWFAHHNVEGAGQELWRGSQMWVWMAPNHIKACWRVLLSESRLLHWLFGGEIKFAVTKKGKVGDDSGIAVVLACTWPYLLWLCAFLAGVIFFLTGCLLGSYNAREVAIYSVSVMWGLMVLLCLFPPLSTLLPREETEEGWRIRWDVIWSGGRDTDALSGTGAASSREPSGGGAGARHADEPPLVSLHKRGRTSSVAEESRTPSHHAINIIRVTTSGSGQRTASGPSQMQQYSAAAWTARATLDSSVGRIALPGRAMAFAQSSLHTQLVLPEPLSSQSAQAHRMLAVNAAGVVMPAGKSADAIGSSRGPSANGGASPSQRPLPCQRDGSAFSSGGGTGAGGSRPGSQPGAGLTIRTTRVCSWQQEQASSSPAAGSVSRIDGEEAACGRQHDAPAPLLPASSSLLLAKVFSTDDGGAPKCVPPAQPGSMYEHTLAAVPNFSERVSPASNVMMLLLNVILLATLVTASLVEVFAGDAAA